MQMTVRELVTEINKCRVRKKEMQMVLGLESVVMKNRQFEDIYNLVSHYLELLEATANENAVNINGIAVKKPVRKKKERK